MLKIIFAEVSIFLGMRGTIVRANQFVLKVLSRVTGLKLGQGCTSAIEKLSRLPGRT